MIMFLNEQDIFFGGIRWPFFSVISLQTTTFHSHVNYLCIIDVGYKLSNYHGHIVLLSFLYIMLSCTHL